MEKVKFGIIGAGNMGSGHFRSFMTGAVTNGECTAIADLLPEKLEEKKKIAEELNPEAGKKVQYFNSGDELIESGCCDAVIIAVPHYDHPVFAIKAMKKGIHAWVEKPAGVYTLQVQEMLDESQKHPELKLGIMFNQRTNPHFKKMKQLIADGELGEITRLNWIITNWYRTQRYYDVGGWRATWKGEGGGVLYNQAPHNIDLFQWIPDMMPNKVHAFCHFGKWHNIEVEDDVTAYFEYPNGATGVFITTTGDAPGTNRFEICGDRGKLVYEGDKLTFVKTDVSIKEYTYTTDSTFAPPAMQNIEIKVEGDNPQHVGILNNFANAVLGIEPLYAPASDGIKGVTLANAMLLSGWMGKAVELPIDGKEFFHLLQQHIKDSKYVKVTAEDTGTADLSSTYNSK